MFIFHFSNLVGPKFSFLFTAFVLISGGFLTHLRLANSVSGLTIQDYKLLLSTSASYLKCIRKGHLIRNIGFFDSKYASSSYANVNPCPRIPTRRPKSSFIKCNYRSIPSVWSSFSVGTLAPEDDDHKMLKDLYLNRDKYFDTTLGKNCNLYRYFNITKSNIKKHLDYTMDEYINRKKEEEEKELYLVDGNSFNGSPDWNLPLPREMESHKIPEAGSDEIVPMGSKDPGIEPKFENEVLESIYKMIPEEADDKRYKSSKDKMVELYEEVGDNDYEVFNDHKVYTKQYFQDYKMRSDEETKRERELLRRVMRHPTVFPSYLDPPNPVHRTGRRREIQKKRDSGRLQRLRWEMDVDYKDDIARGNWDKGDELTKEFNDSIEWEELMPTHQDSNYFKRNYYEDGFADEDRTPDSYFDVQFIGSTDAYPFALSAGMQFTWPIYWLKIRDIIFRVPWLCKKNPKMRGQPIRSPVFNLGGIEPLQLWFYPEGSAQSADGYCSLKLISPPGWNLPCRIYLYVFSEYNRVVLGPMYRESAEYIANSLNTCRLVPKNKELLENPENDKDYVILGPSGNVYVGVGIVDEPIRSHNQKHEFKYDWDEGDYEFNQWLKKQTSNPDDQFTMDTIEKDRTHSIWYESHKYKYVPDRHISRYWKTRYSKDVVWNPPNLSF